MKLKLFIAALIVAFAAPVMADGGSDSSDPLMRVAQKKKQKRKGKTAAAAAVGAAAVAAGSTISAEPAKSEPSPPTATPVPAEAAKPASNESVVKTDLYTVVDGTKVDAKTLDGFKIWRAAACDRCHGANQEGMVGPSLLESIRKLTKSEFVTVLKDGRLEKGMPPWNTNDQVMKGMDNLYAYLKGRADGAITKAKVTAME